MRPQQLSVICAQRVSVSVLLSQRRTVLPFFTVLWLWLSLGLALGVGFVWLCLALALALAWLWLGWVCFMQQQPR